MKGAKMKTHWNVINQTVAQRQQHPSNPVFVFRIAIPFPSVALFASVQLAFPALNRHCLRRVLAFSFLWNAWSTGCAPKGVGCLSVSCVGINNDDTHSVDQLNRWIEIVITIIAANEGVNWIQLINSFSLWFNYCGARIIIRFVGGHSVMIDSDWDSFWGIRWRNL